MIAVITGDIIASRSLQNQSVWLLPLKDLLSQWGTTPKQWIIQDGDRFQLEVSDPKNALLYALKIKALIRSTLANNQESRTTQIDVRMAIGVGEKTYDAQTIAESNGSAFVYSGEHFSRLKKEGNTLFIRTANSTFNTRMNLYFKFAQRVMNNWSISSAELMQIVLENPAMNQTEIASLLQIKQPSVSGRFYRAQVSEILELEQLFRKELEAIIE